MKTVILDTETTGLLKASFTPITDQPKIIEIGAIVLDGDSIVNKYSQLIDPQEPIEKKITEITKLTDEDLKGQPLFADVVPIIESLFKDADYLICHNAPFDTGMLENDLKRCGRPDVKFPNEIICTVQEYNHLFGKRPKLTDLYKLIMEKELEQTHRALDDCMALHELLMKDNFFPVLEDRLNEKKA